MPEQAKRTTIRDVARVAAVDPAVVSRVLGNDPKLTIRDSTRERVLKAAASLQYRPNAMARSLRTATTGTFGLLIPDFRNPIYSAIIAGAEAAASARDNFLLTASYVGAELRTDRYIDMVLQGRVDGMLIAAEPPGELGKRLREVSLPTILLNGRPPNTLRSIRIDDERAALLAVNHLIELGHSRIGHVAGPTQRETSTRRLRGWKRALTAAGLSSDPGLVARGSLTPAGGAKAMANLLQAGPRPTAVFVGNGAAAIGALFAAEQAGLRVPDELAVIAIHNLPLFDYISPDLTTVHIPLAEMGARGVDLLATSKHDEPIDETISEPIEIVLRGSTAPPAAQPVRRRRAHA